MMTDSKIIKMGLTWLSIVLAGTSVLWNTPNMVLNTYALGRAAESNATPANATISDAIKVEKWSADIWDGIEMSESFQGKGTREFPYLLESANDLKLLAYQVANEEESGVNGYESCYFKVTKDITLKDKKWNPIGFLQSIDDRNTIYPFKGNFDGNGKTISGLYYGDSNTMSYIGLFGKTQGAVIKNLTVRGRVSAYDLVGGIVGESNQTVLENCKSYVSVVSANRSGGIAGAVNAGVISDCINYGDVHSGTAGGDSYTGGITGYNLGAVISDCENRASNGEYTTAYSEGATGGICGVMEYGGIYNCLVTATVGNYSSDCVGGIVGEIRGGEVKNNRFDGSIKYSMEIGKAAGIFIGKVTGGNLGDEISNLYCNQTKFTLKPFGEGPNSGVRESHRIGVYHSDNRVSLWTMRTGINPVPLPHLLFQVLEQGVLEIDNEIVHHYAPDATGKVVRGYLVTVPGIANGTLSVKQTGDYSYVIDQANPGAIAFGSKVRVFTEPVNIEGDAEQNIEPTRFTLIPNSLCWYTLDGTGKQSVILEDEFVMPDKNILVSAEYTARADGVKLSQKKLSFTVEQIRSGSRWEPDITYQITSPIKLEAAVIPSTADNQEVFWTTTDADVLKVENGLVTVNQSAAWIESYIQSAVESQKLHTPSKPIVLEKSKNTFVSVTTRDGHFIANCPVTVALKITDETYVPVQSVQLDKQELSFDVEKVMTGSRLSPKVEYKVTPSQRLYAIIGPAYAKDQSVKWSVNDTDGVYVDPSGLVSVTNDAKWISDLIKTDQKNIALNPYAISTANGRKTAYVTVSTTDGGRTDVCGVTIQFKTSDQTQVMVEGVSLVQKKLEFEVEAIKEGRRTSPTVRYAVTDPQKIVSMIIPSVADHKNIVWSGSNNDLLHISPEGIASINQDGLWLKELLQNKKKKDVLTASVTATTEEGAFEEKCEIKVSYKLTDRTYSGGSSGSSGDSFQGGGSGSGNNIKGMGAVTSGVLILAGGSWTKDKIGWWYQYKDGSYPRAQWMLDRGYWYYFDTMGYMATGWHLIDGKWYFLDPTEGAEQGKMISGTRTVDGYDVGSDGAWIPEP